jgi:hypothetical protein
LIVSELAKAYRISPAGPPPAVSLKVSMHAPGGLQATVHSVASAADRS